MRIGYHLTAFWSPSDRSATQIIDGAIEAVAASSTMGYEWVSVGHHMLTHPAIWPQPIPFLARVAPVSGRMQLKTSVLLVPLLNPVELAENAATLDHICHGRLVLGLSIGYRERELQAVGLTRKDRVPKLVESIEVMKRLWAGEEVTYRGKYVQLDRARLGFTPYQRPHPPIEVGTQSEAATRRAARLTDGVFFGPQVSWADVGRLAEVYRRARAEAGHADLGILGASRSLIVGRDKEDATNRARQFLQKTFDTYRAWDMQERGMVELQLGFDKALEDWTICGSPADCVEAIERGREQGLNALGFTIYSLPPDPKARIEYLQMIAEEIVAKVKRE